MSPNTQKPPVRWRLPAALAVILAILLLAIIPIVFQDNLARFALKPRMPLQTLTPPPAPEYGARGAWFLWPSEAVSGAADIFYVHSTTYYSRDHWNAPITDPDADSVLRVTAAPNEAGPFLNLGSVYGPRYRQATLFSFFTHKYDGVAARQNAFADIDEAFQTFLTHADNPERPIILAGYGQGGLHVLGLLQRHVNEDEALRKRIAAAYVIGHAIPPEFFSTYATDLKICAGPKDDRCIISYVDYEPKFNEEMRRARSRTMVWNKDGELIPVSGEAPLCINPLSWTSTETGVLTMTTQPSVLVKLATCQSLETSMVTGSRRLRSIGAEAG